MSASSVYTMVIELRSDMCCGTGEANGVSLNQVTALDKYGLPIIPAKRLKGLLREEAQLIDCSGMVDELFGQAGGRESGKLTFGEAKLVGYEHILGRIKESNGGITPGLVTSVYTTSRTGTRVKDDGVVADHTLRTIQLVRKCDSAGIPTRFVCGISGTNLTTEEKDLLNNAVRCLRAIGLGKSRGMGEVCCHGVWNTAQEEGSDPTPSVPAKARVGYRITLNSPAVVQGGAGESLDYIPGSAMQGLFAGLFCKSDKEFVEQHILQNTRFLNGYVDISESSMSTPVPFNLRTQKNAAGTKDVQTEVLKYPLYDQALDQWQDGVQQVGIDGYGAIADNEYLVAEVTRSLSFHSSNQNSPQGKQYYSMQSIDAGQSFSGAIIADPESIRRIQDACASYKGTFRIGTAKGSGFGSCDVDFFSVEDAKSIDVYENDRVVIRLVSDVVFIDKNGTNSTDIAAFAEYLSSSGVLGFEFNANMDSGDKSCKVFAKTCVVGGYNSFWGLPKRQYMAFKKGSVIVATVTSKGSRNVSYEAWAGLLQAEGFGQLAIGKVEEHELRGSYVRCSTVRASSFIGGDAFGYCEELEKLGNQAAASFGRDLTLYEVLDEVLLRACELASEFKPKSVSKSSFMRISLILASACKSPKDVLISDAFMSLAKDNFQKDDEALFDKCVELVHTYSDLMADKELLDAYCKNLVFRRYVLEYLRQVKVKYTLTKGVAHE